MKNVLAKNHNFQGDNLRNLKPVIYKCQGYKDGQSNTFV